jgi:hypothetical protein
MNTRFSKPTRPAVVAAFCFTMMGSSLLHSEEAAVSAQEMASKLSALRQDGNSYIRVRMEIKGGSDGGTLQLEIKSHRTPSASEVVYQILFPRERKGEAVILRKSAGSAGSGSIVSASGAVRPLAGSQMSEGLFGSDLAYEDTVDNFFGWEHQTIVGTEKVSGVNCQILESKPGKKDQSSYTSVKSWIDTSRMVPLRIDKYVGGGKQARRIDTISVHDDDGRSIPENLLVRRPGQETSTKFDGSRLKRGMSYSDSDFTPEGLKKAAAPAQ